MKGYVSLADRTKGGVRRAWKSWQLKLVNLQPGLHTARHVVVVVAKNEKERLAFFIDYHRSLGFEEFIFIDNMSTDGSIEYLKKQQGVTLYLADGNYSRSRYGVDWVNHVVRRHCHDKWVLSVDADEFLVYPGCPSMNIAALTSRLEICGSESLFCTMIDLYASGKTSDALYTSGMDPLSICNRFDRSGYVSHRDEVRETTWIKGGVRGRVFFGEDLSKGPALNKTPLVKWKRHYLFMKSTHQLWPPHINGKLYRDGVGTTGALLHFKFLSTNKDKIEDTATRNQHTREYANYVGRYDVEMTSDISQVYEGWETLCQAGLMSRDHGFWSMVIQTEKDARPRSVSVR